MKPFEKDILANNKLWLEQKYLNELLSLKEISEICKVSSDTIRTRLKKFNIEIRNPSIANKISVNKKPEKYEITEKLKNRHKRMKTGKTVVCENCNKEFYKSNCKIKSLNFCSKTCKKEYLRKNINRNQDWRDYPEYDEWRKTVYKRDNWRCLICKNKIKINAHHIFDGATHVNLRFSIENGITLCEKHHIMVHKNPRSFIKELIKQTSNIGGHLEEDNPEALIRNILYALTTTKRNPDRIMV